MFYEKTSGYLADSTNLFAWESANNAISTVNVRRNRFSFGNFANSEYLALSIVMIVLQFAFTVLGYFRITTLCDYPVTLLLFHIFIVVICVVFSVLISCATSIKNCMQKPAIKYTAGFVLYGKKQGIIPETISTEEMVEAILQKSKCIDDELSGYLKNYKNQHSKYGW